jgi:hypothetical protein
MALTTDKVRDAVLYYFDDDPAAGVEFDEWLEYAASTGDRL